VELVRLIWCDLNVFEVCLFDGFLYHVSSFCLVDDLGEFAFSCR